MAVDVVQQKYSNNKCYVPAYRYHVDKSKGEECVLSYKLSFINCCECTGKVPICLAQLFTRHFTMFVSL